MAEERIVCIKDLRQGMKNITSMFIVIDKGTTNLTKDGSVVRKCRVADKTGSVFFSLWNEQAEAIESGDILRLTKGYASVWKGSLVLYSGKYGVVEKIGEFTMLFSETPDMSECISEQTGVSFQAQRGPASRPSPVGNRNDMDRVTVTDAAQPIIEPAKRKSPPEVEQPSSRVPPQIQMQPRYQSAAHQSQHLPSVHHHTPRIHLADPRAFPRPFPDSSRYHPYQRPTLPLASQTDGWM